MDSSIKKPAKIVCAIIMSRIHNGKPGPFPFNPPISSRHAGNANTFICDEHGMQI